MDPEFTVNHTTIRRYLLTSHGQYAYFAWFYLLGDLTYWRFLCPRRFSTGCRSWSGHSQRPLPLCRFSRASRVGNRSLVILRLKWNGAGRKIAAWLPWLTLVLKTVAVRMRTPIPMILNIRKSLMPAFDD